MDRDEYNRLLADRRRFGVRPLTEARPRRRAAELTPLSAVGHVLARAARQVKRRELALEAWRRIAPPQLLNEVSVVGVSEDTLELWVGSPAVGFEFARRKAALEAALCRAVPGVRRVRVSQAAGGGPARSDPEESV